MSLENGAEEVSVTPMNEDAQDGEAQMLAGAESCTPESTSEETIEGEGEPVVDVFSDAPISLREAVTALLFVAPRPLTAAQLAEHCEVSTESVEEVLTILQTELNALEVGYEIREIGGSWQFRTRASAARIITKLIPPRARKLSKAAAETLAVIAYKQPVPRSEIEAIRGVDALPTLKTLLDAKLIRVIGREDSVGHPALYGTTPTFLEKYGLRDLSELPTIREVVELKTEPGEVTEDTTPTETEEGGEIQSAPDELTSETNLESVDTTA